MIPTTSQPEFRASIVAAEMTEFIPGAGPAPREPGDPDKRAGPDPEPCRITDPGGVTRTARTASIQLMIMRA